jgi:hypothetical protein
MTGPRYSGMDVHKESISIAVRNDAGKIVMECVIETKANIILDFKLEGIRSLLGHGAKSITERYARPNMDVLRCEVGPQKRN